jgi:hypothetical protein
MAVIANEVKQSFGMMQISLKTLARKLTDWFNETPIHCVRNDKGHKFSKSPKIETFWGFCIVEF